MKKKILAYGVLFFMYFAFFYLFAAAQTDDIYTRRFAFIVGSNFGGEDRVTLRYAVTDARAFEDVLKEMGGVLSGDSYFLEEPSRENFFKQIKSLTKEVEKSNKDYRRLEVIFYYSGHSDEENLFLGNDRLAYMELRELITGMNADVRIAILDSCASGALTLPKGVIKRSPFLADTAYDMKGYAFMTSSSANEAAQESGRLRKSYFTHNLISAMRGAADMNQDGRITLNEAYQVAFDGTLLQTERTMAGPQHPNYHIQMSGTGDVVITEIWKSMAVLVLKKDIAGKIYIHNENDVLLVELTKSEGREIAIGLNEGRYRLINIDRRSILESNVSLETGKSFKLDRDLFVQTDKIPTRQRGDQVMLIPEYPIPRKVTRWRAEFFGGIAGMNPSDLNLRAHHDEQTRMFFNDNYFNHLFTQGEIAGFSNQNEGGSPKLIKFSAPFGIRFKYSLNHWLEFSLGFTSFACTRDSHFRNDYGIFLHDGTSIYYYEDLTSYKLSAKGFVPSFGIHAGKTLNPLLRIEAFFSGGPLIAECSYYIDILSQEWTGGSGNDIENPVQGMLEERGKGTGLSLQAGLKLDFLLSKRTGFFLEGGYAYQTVFKVSGPGTRIYPTRQEYWDGEWGIKKKVVQKPWGTLHNVYPSNGWEGFESTGWKDRDFKLNLSGIQMRIGLIYRF
jgi:hypothetical protein